MKRFNFSQPGLNLTLQIESTFSYGRLEACLIFCRHDLKLLLLAPAMQRKLLTELMSWNVNEGAHGSIRTLLCKHYGDLQTVNIVTRAMLSIYYNPTTISHHGFSDETCVNMSKLTNRLSMPALSNDEFRRWWHQTPGITVPYRLCRAAIPENESTAPNELRAFTASFVNGGIDHSRQRYCDYG